MKVCKSKQFGKTNRGCVFRVRKRDRDRIRLCGKSVSQVLNREGVRLESLDLRRTASDIRERKRKIGVSEIKRVSKMKSCRHHLFKERWVNKTISDIWHTIHTGATGIPIKSKQLVMWRILEGTSKHPTSYKPIQLRDVMCSFHERLRKKD